jgi:hypothetical protein
LIELIGSEGTAEYAAAKAIADALEELWPGIASTGPDIDLIKIISGAKISGYQISDIDVVLCARFRGGRRFVPRKVLKDAAGGRVINAPVEVENLVVAIEVKDHSTPNVRFVGDSISVRYSRSGPVEWKSATEQNIAQVHSLRQYFDDQHIELFVHRLLVMRGLDSVNANGAVPLRFTGAELIGEIASVSHVFKGKGGYVMRSARAEAVDRALAAPLFRAVVPTSLDRMKMDRIAARRKDTDARLAVLGSKMVIFRGRGGSGKTIMLLQTAWAAFEQRALRTLILTYNHALAADITRLMALLHIPSAGEQGGIAVRTVMSFMFSWFSRLGVLDRSEPAEWSGYLPLCNQALELLDAGALTVEDIQARKDSDPDKFDYDLIIIDEAQDWPAEEQALLKRLYEARQFCLADGVDQLVRGSRTDWTVGVPAGRREVIPLRRSLRMKANLAVFANAVADRAGLNWSVGPNDQAAGGRIILVEGTLVQSDAVYREVLDATRAAGNQEIDMLFCVPPDDVSSSAEGNESALGRHLAELGAEVWDATDANRRKDFPRSTAAHRVVQYQSCRGLEGWSVFAERLDAFWVSSRSSYLAENPLADTSLRDPADAAEEAAWRWCMTVLTRPIDTLVISLGSRDSPCARIFGDIARERPDLIEVR